MEAYRNGHAGVDLPILPHWYDSENVPFTDTLRNRFERGAPLRGLTVAGRGLPSTAEESYFDSSLCARMYSGNHGYLAGELKGNRLDLIPEW